MSTSPDIDMSPYFLDTFRRTWGLHTLGLRLVVGYAILFVSSIVLLAVLAYGLFNRFLHEPDRAFMHVQALELADKYERGGINALRRDLNPPPNDERREELLVRLADPSGRTVLLYNPDRWTVSEIGKLEAQSTDEAEAWLQLGPAEDDDALEAFSMQLADGHLLQVGMDADLRKDAMESMRDVFLAIALPVLILALLGGAFLAYRALRPVRHLAETLQAVIDTGDVKTRVPEADVRGEFGDVVRLFNRMLGRIEALMNGMHTTLDHVAHDLRTPLTRLRGRAEMALQQERDTAGLREALADNLEETETVTTMLDSIMDLAEAEVGTLPLNTQQLHLADLVDDVVELYDLVAEVKGLSISSDIPTDLVITADRSRFRQAVANLVDNAVKYTPPGGCVTLVGRRDGDTVSLRIRDTGIGIAPEERSRIWDRLYRGDRSRSERGLGLGLSLVKAIVEAHGGDVDVESVQGSGAGFVVRLPDTRRRDGQTL